jgi:hypothetical protein
MQVLRAVLSGSVGADRFLEAWRSDTQSGAPVVDFDFSVDGHVTMRVHSAPTAPWDEASFKQTFALVTHRVAPGCKISWLQ